MAGTRFHLPRGRLCLAIVALLAGALMLGSAERGQAAPLPTGFEEDVLPMSGLSTPTAVRFSPDPDDERVFVAEKSGLIKVFDGVNDSSPTQLADLRTQVHNFLDRGLLGLALDPDFPADPYVYVLYTYDFDPAVPSDFPRWGTPGQTSDPCPTPPGPTMNGCVVTGRLSRLQVSGNQMIPGSEQVLIEDWCQQFPSHSIGSLAFAADGALYVSGGDGASYNYADYGQTGNPCGDPSSEGGALRSQDVRTTSDPTSLDGAILRVNPTTGEAMAGNPTSSGDDNADRMVANGFRNPFRFTVRPDTNEIWIGDVGWNQWEEIDRLADPAGAPVENFGWPCYEGDNDSAQRQPGYDGLNLSLCENLYQPGDGAVQAPYYAYLHSGDVVDGEPCGSSGSISGLAFYEGGNYPSEYDGALFFSDYTRSCIWAMFPGGDGLPDPDSRITFASDAASVDLQIGPGGNLFYVDIVSGTVRRIRYRGPTAVATANPQSGPTPLEVDFDGTASSDPDGGQLDYAWDLDGDGAFDDSNDPTDATPSWTYEEAGNYTVRLQVTDDQGASDESNPITISAGDPPTATIDKPAPGTTFATGEKIAFSGHATDPGAGSLPPSALSWSLDLMHCPSGCHTHPVETFEGTAAGSFNASDHERPYHLDLRLTATDSDGLEDTKTVRLDPTTPSAPGPPPSGSKPSNDFSIGKLKRNRERGTAKLTIEVPGPGTLDLGGKRAKEVTERAADAGKVKLPVRPSRRKMAKLLRLGEVELRIRVTFTPDGGNPHTEMATLTLIKRPG